jgi:glycosyltransferase involved in cell wall biosynthesis
LKVLLLNQCFWPDVVATAQQSTGVARALAERGHKVTVIAARRGYDDAALSFPARETWNEIEIVRLPSISFGKRSRWRRALNFASFSLAATYRLILTKPQDRVIALTSPPLISWLASLFTRLKGGRMIFWVMDLNPDEAIAAGWLGQNSMPARILAALSQSSMRHAEKIIVLDRFMKARIAAKGISEDKIEVIAPSRDETVAYDERGREAFRDRHGLSEKFVVMYAGNHSPCHPLDTVLEAAKQLHSRPDIVFCFVGGGSGLTKVEDFVRTNELKNICSLPYQAQADLPALLSAADLHLVVMGEAFPGIVHPCKIYNIMATGSPFLYVGPKESHVADIIEGLRDQQQASWARHGDVDDVIRILSEKADSFFSNRGRALRFDNPFAPTLSQLVMQIESTPSDQTAEAEPIGSVRSPTVREGLAIK